MPKTSTITVRVRDDLKEQIEYLKLLPGGLTKFIESSIAKVKVDRELLAKLNKLK
jgi:hypothetical protein